MELVNEISNLGKNNRSILAILLSGSRARGDYHQNSDYDFMVIVKCLPGNWKKKYDLEQTYKDYISQNMHISSYLVQVSVWPKKEYERERKKGNSFIYLNSARFLYTT